MWFFWPLLYHQFGTQSVSQFVPCIGCPDISSCTRRRDFPTVAGCFLIKEAMSAWRFANGRRIVMATGLAMLLVHLHFNWRGEQIVYGAYHRIKGTYAESGIICRRRAEDRGGSRRSVLLRFLAESTRSESVQIVPFANYSRCDELKPGVVLTHSNPGWEGSGAPVIQETVARLPCLVHPPADWRLVYDGYPERCSDQRALA